MPPGDAHSFWLLLMQRILKLSNGLLLKSEYTLILIFPHQKKKSNQLYPYFLALQKHLLAVVFGSFYPLTVALYPGESLFSNPALVSHDISQAVDLVKVRT